MDWKSDYAKQGRHGRGGDQGRQVRRPRRLRARLRRAARARRRARRPRARAAHVEIVHMVAMGKGEYAQPEYAEIFFHNSLFVGASTRDAVKRRPRRLHPRLLPRDPQALLRGLPAARRRRSSTSRRPTSTASARSAISVDYTKPAAQVAKTVIAQVNPNMPRTHGDSFIHVCEIDFVVESEQPIIELPPPKIGPVEEAIGKHIAGLVDDGACLQLGIGGIPDAVLLFLHEKNDLGIHTEMFSEGVVDLYNEGVITNRNKTHQPRQDGGHLPHGHAPPLRLRRRQPGRQHVPGQLRQRPLRDRPERQRGGDQLGDPGRPHGPGRRRRDGPDRSSPASAARSTSCAAPRAAATARRSSPCRRRPRRAPSRASSRRWRPAPR